MCIFMSLLIMTWLQDSHSFRPFILKKRNRLQSTLTKKSHDRTIMKSEVSFRITCSSQYKTKTKCSLLTERLPYSGYPGLIFGFPVYPTNSWAIDKAIDHRDWTRHWELKWLQKDSVKISKRITIGCQTSETQVVLYSREHMTSLFKVEVTVILKKYNKEGDHGTSV